MDNLQRKWHASLSTRKGGWRSAIVSVFAQFPLREPNVLAENGSSFRVGLQRPRRVGRITAGPNSFPGNPGAFCQIRRNYKRRLEGYRGANRTDCSRNQRFAEQRKE